jgi:hypothetical protein
MRGLRREEEGTRPRAKKASKRWLGYEEKQGKVVV